jgi:tetratricopeptide (TPR) repeat protein
MDIPHIENNDEAITYFQKAIVADPTYADAYFHIGVAFFNKQDFDQAIAYYEKALNANPAFYLAYITWALFIRISAIMIRPWECYEKRL